MSLRDELNAIENARREAKVQASKVFTDVRQLSREFFQLARERCVPQREDGYWYVGSEARLLVKSDGSTWTETQTWNGYQRAEIHAATTDAFVGKSIDQIRRAFIQRLGGPAGL